MSYLTAVGLIFFYLVEVYGKEWPSRKKSLHGEREAKIDGVGI